MELYGYEFVRESDLKHHGILGQRWGKKNGPPYPLDAKDHSSSEQKAGWRKSLDKSGAKGFKLTPGQKKAALIGASIVAAGLVGYGLYKTGALDSIGNYVKNGKEVLDTGFGNSNHRIIGRHRNDVDTKMVHRINRANRNSPGGRMNCFHTTTAYVLNAVLGKNVTALPYDGIDEISGLTGIGRDYHIFNSIFDGLNIHECPKDESMYDMFKSLKDGSTGVIHIRAGGVGHYINYEKTLNGEITVIDPQTDRITGISEYVSSGRYSPWRVIDCSNATLKPNAGEILKYMVKGFK